MDFKEAFALNVNSKTEDEFVILKNNVRISVITNRLIRVEHNNKKLFVDEPTQKVWYRAFSSPKFSQAEKGNSIIINTSEVEFCCDTISGKVKYITIDKNKITNFKKGNLGGTYRTLDMTRGAVKLGDGVVSKNGATVFDDSASLILKPDGAIEPRKNSEQDKYYFAYGRNYRECIKAFFELTGYTPLVPRFCLGNWWSRYKAYSQQEYVDLMTRFLDEEIPITVATIDMDWHWVDVVSKFGEKAKRKVAAAKNFREVIWEHGWTGYSWNTDLFPDYKGFLKWLKEKISILPLIFTLLMAFGLLKICMKLWQNIWGKIHRTDIELILKYGTLNMLKHILNICIIHMKKTEWIFGGLIGNKAKIQE
ncbi:MAG: glycoside hydrolase family 31 protein [Oscillospiraceae bacterium]